MFVSIRRTQTYISKTMRQ